MSDLLSELFAHNWWANARLLAELQRGAPDPETMRLLAHLVAAEHVWLSRIDGRTPRYAVWPTLPLDEAAALATENRARVEALLAQPHEARARIVRYRNSAGNAFETPVGEILTHVALHSQYHRGQIARTMRASGREPVYTDYVGYARREQGER